MEKNEQIIEIWNKLPFSSFRDEKKISEWRNYALQILSNLDIGNVGLTADTGTGKTIMAFLVFEALKVRTLFVTPTVILTRQHKALYDKISGQEANILYGGIKNRDWHSGNLVIATPHVFMVDQAKGLINENSFDLLIVDESHKAQGFYPYVPIAKLFKASGKKILCLSASPATSYDEIAEMEITYGLKSWVTAEIETPEKKQRFIKTLVSSELKEAEVYLSHAYLDVLKQLDKLFKEIKKQQIFSLDEANPFLTQADSDKLSKVIDTLPTPELYSGKSLFAKQYKLAYVYRLLMTESYFSFLAYVEESLKSDKSKAAQAILLDPGFSRLYLLIKNIKAMHPKEEALYALIREMTWKNKSMLVFVASKKTARYLSALFNSLGYKSDVLLGGAGKSVKSQTRVIEEFSQKKIQIIFATSVVEEGLSLPEIDVVVHYNQPTTGIARLQRGGRTGRFREGLIAFIVMDVAYENALYFATLAKLKKMQRIFYESARNMEKEKKAKKKKGQVKITGQFSLIFPDEYPF